MCDCTLLQWIAEYWCWIVGGVFGVLFFGWLVTPTIGEYEN